MKWAVPNGSVLGFPFLVALLITADVFCSMSSDSDSDSESPPPSSTSSPEVKVLVQTRFGYVRGVQSKTKNGNSVEYFKGIPYADKPERLKKSILVHRWNNAYDASAYKKRCIGIVRPVNASVSSEDCLYLNIVRPAGITNLDRIPVVIFIHGGGFVEGSGYDPSLESFAEKFVPQNLLIVTIQYRLAMSGFLSLGCSSPLIPCNIGLWDQLTAFRFVNRTISDFGGDTRNMTLMGHSAGAMSVSLHSMSPISSRFFTNYIQMSSSSWGLTSYAQSNLDQSLKILKDLNCNITSQEQILDCINHTSLDDMYTAQIDTHLWPNFGDELLPDIPQRIVNNTKDQRLMAGIMTLESLYFTYLKSSPEIFPYIHRETVQEYINTSIAMHYGVDSTNAFNMASGYFLSSNVSDDDYSYFMWQRTRIESNQIFDIPVLRELYHKRDHSKDIYFYYFPYFNDAEFDKDFPVKATYHCHEFPYVWDIYKDNRYQMNADDHLVSEFFVGALVNFIKSGNPSNSNYTWPRIDSELSYTVIKPKPATDKNYFKADYDFWDRMARTFQYDLITGLPVETISTTSGSPSTFSSLLILPLSLIIIFNA